MSFLLIVLSITALLFVDLSTTEAASSYYASTEGLTGNSLLEELARLTRSNHKTTTSYDSLKTHLKNTDPDPKKSGYILDFYSQISTSSWNREHVWPKSLSGGTYQNSGAGADVHHIRPTIEAINSKRGNMKFTDFDVINQSANEYKYNNVLAAYTNNTYWEPLDNVKGDTARIVMYMYMHYNNTTIKANSGYSLAGNMQIENVVYGKGGSKDAALEILLYWNKLDPVDTYEANRNDVASGITGARNPFIDYPEFADAIWSNGSSVNPDDNIGGGTTQPDNPSQPDTPVTPDEPVVSGSTAKLVTNVNDLKANDKIIIAALNSNNALGTTQNGNNRSQAGVTKSGDTLTFGNDTQVITLTNGTQSNTYGFYTGTSGYLYAAGGTGKNNYLRTKTSLDLTGSWNITISSSGSATIKTADTSVQRNTIMHNTSASIFSCYASGQQPVAIYKVADTHECEFSDELVYNQTHHWYECECGKISSKEVHDVTSTSYEVKDGNVLKVDVCSKGHSIYSNLDKDAIYEVNNEDDLRLLLTNGYEVVLTNNITLTSTIILDGNVTSTLNLGGKTLDIISEDRVLEVFLVKNGATLTIDGEGHVNANSVYESNEHVEVLSAIDNGIVNIYGGTFTSNGCTAVYATRGGIINIYGGTFEATTPYYGVLYTLDVNEAESVLGAINVYGGSYVSFNPANHKNDGSYSNKLASNELHSIVNGNVYTVAAHSYTWATKEEATCTTAEVLLGTCECGDTTTKEGQAALGHSEIVAIPVYPTCTETGLSSVVYCDRCDETLVESVVIPATGHTEVVDQAVAATCTTTGLTEGKHCSVCNEVLVAQQEVPMLEHDYDMLQNHETHHWYKCECGLQGQKEEHKFTWEQVSAATCTEDEVLTATCSVCSYTETKTGEIALGHAEVLDAAKEATCTTTGLTKGSHCEVCGEVLKEQEVIPTLEHTYSQDYTCDETHHWYECECGVTSAKIAHEGGEATEEEKAVCQDCGASYGELKEPSNDDNTELLPEDIEDIINDAKEGCAGSILTSLFGLLTLTGLTLVLRRKRKENN